MLKQCKSHNLLWNLPRDSEISNCASGPAAWSTPKRRSDSTTFPPGWISLWTLILMAHFHGGEHFISQFGCFQKNGGIYTPKMNGEKKWNTPIIQWIHLGGKPHYFRFNIQFVGEGESWLCFKTYLRSYFITRVRQDITLVTTPNKRIGETRTITKGLATCQFYSILRVDFPM